LSESQTREHTAPRHSLKSPGSCKMPRGKKKEPAPEPEENEVMEDAAVEDDDEESAVSLS